MWFARCSAFFATGAVTIALGLISQTFFNALYENLPPQEQTTPGFTSSSYGISMISISLLSLPYLLIIFEFEIKTNMLGS